MAEAIAPRLIESRFHLAVPRPDDIERADLLALLPNSAGGPRLSLITAPAGWGKSTLVSQLGAHLDLPIAYVAFDERDTDVRRALAYLTEAIRRAVPELELAPLVEASPSIWIDESLPVIVQHLSEHGRSVACVLDDYHLVGDSGLHAVVAALVEHLPVGCHVVIAGRQPPPFPTARLRVSRELLEIGPNELRLTPDLTDEVLRTVFDLALSEHDVLLLTERTEGWPAGVALAGLSLVEVPDR